MALRPTKNPAASARYRARRAAADAATAMAAARTMKRAGGDPERVQFYVTIARSCARSERTHRQEAARFAAAARRDRAAVRAGRPVD